jgi:hypothetical protein
MLYFKNIIYLFIFYLFCQEIHTEINKNIYIFFSYLLASIHIQFETLLNSYSKEKEIINILFRK